MADSEGSGVVVTLRRKDTGQPWGFRMTGGKDLGCHLYIAKVTPRSLSAKCGLRTGDVVISIEQVPANNLSHDHAKAEILRAGNDLHLVVRRGSDPPGEQKQDPLANRRSMVVEEETEYKGDPNPTSQSRTFHLLNQFLHEELEELSKKPEKVSKAANGPRPASASECGPIRGSTYSARKAPGGTPTDSPQGPSKESLKATSDRPASSPVKQPTVASSEASPNKTAHTAAASSVGKPGDAKTDKSTGVPKPGDARTDKSSAVPKTGSVDVKANKPSAASAPLSANSKAKVSPAAVQSVPISDSTDSSVVVSADADVDLPVVVSVDADVSESVDMEAPLTIVAIDDDPEGDSVDYSDADYTGGSVSEGSEEAATSFTIQMN